MRAYSNIHYGDDCAWSFFYNKMHVTHIKGHQHFLRLELRLEINQEA